MTIFPAYHCRTQEEFHETALNLSHLRKPGFERLTISQVPDSEVYYPTLTVSRSFWEWILEFFFCYKPVTLQLRTITEFAVQFLEENSEYLFEERDLLIEFRGRISSINSDKIADLYERIDTLVTTTDPLSDNLRMRAEENAISIIHTARDALATVNLEAGNIVSAARERAALEINDALRPVISTLRKMKDLSDIMTISSDSLVESARARNTELMNLHELALRTARCIYPQRDHPISKLFNERDESGDITLKCKSGHTVKAHSELLNQLESFAGGRELDFTEFSQADILFWLRFVYAESPFLHTDLKTLSRLMLLSMKLGGPTHLLEKCKEAFDNCLNMFLFKINHLTSVETLFVFFESIEENFVPLMQLDLINKNTLQKIIQAIVWHSHLVRLIEDKRCLENLDLLAFVFMNIRRSEVIDNQIFANFLSHFASLNELYKAGLIFKKHLPFIDGTLITYFDSERLSPTNKKILEGLKAL